MGRIGILPVGLGGRNPVHEHLRHIPPGHRNRANRKLSALCRFYVVVGPVLVVVAVMALVMDPGLGIALDHPLSVVGTLLAVLVKVDAVEKFHRCKLGQVMGQTLPVEANLKAAFCHQSLVVKDGSQVTDDLFRTQLPIRYRPGISAACIFAGFPSFHLEGLRSGLQQR